MLLVYAPDRTCPTTVAALEQHGARLTRALLSDWDLYLTHSSHTLNTLLPSRTDQWLSRIPGVGHLTNKAALWQGLRRALGRAAASRLTPETWVLPHDREHLTRNKRDGLYIAKNPTLDQRRGLRLCEGTDAALAAAEEGLTVIQRMLPDLLLLDRHRFHVRVYVLLVWQEGALRAWRHTRGRCIWAPEPLEDGPRSPAALITRGDALLPGRPIHLHGLMPLLQPYPPMFPLINDLLQQVLSVIRPHIHQQATLPNPMYHLLGADIVLTATGEARLIELNSGPDLRARTPEDGVMKSGVAADVFRLIGLLPATVTGFVPLELS